MVCNQIKVPWGYIDVGNLLMLATLCWLQLLGVGTRRLCYKIKDFGDENDQNRQQHLKVVANTFCLKHPSLIDVDLLGVNK